MAAFDLIEEQVLGSNATNVTFSSIPATYAHLHFEMTVEANSSDEPVYVQFNGDATSNYTWFRYYSYNGTSSQGIQFDAHPSGEISIGDAIAQSTVGSIDLWIPNYAHTDRWKSVVGKVMNKKWWSQSGGAWKSTAAINSIKIYTPVSSNLKSGGQFKLWGLKDSN